MYAKDYYFCTHKRRRKIVFIWFFGVIHLYKRKPVGVFLFLYLPVIPVNYH